MSGVVDYYGVRIGVVERGTGMGDGEQRAETTAWMSRKRALSRVSGAVLLSHTASLALRAGSSDCRRRSGGRGGEEADTHTHTRRDADERCAARTTVTVGGAGHMQLLGTQRITGRQTLAANFNRDCPGQAAASREEMTEMMAQVVWLRISNSTIYLSHISQPCIQQYSCCRYIVLLDTWPRVDATLDY